MRYVRVCKHEHDSRKIQFVDSLDESRHYVILKLSVVLLKTFVNLPRLVILHEGLVHDVLRPGRMTIENSN